MLIRLAIAIAIGYLLYRLFRSRKRSMPEEGPSQRVPREDVMVQDPWCKTYVPRSQSIEVTARGRVLHFCSQECRERFLEEQRKETH